MKDYEAISLQLNKNPLVKGLCHACIAELFEFALAELGAPNGDPPFLMRAGALLDLLAGRELSDSDKRWLESYFNDQA